MRNLSPILTCVVVLPVALLSFHASTGAGEIYREGLFLAYLEQSDALSLPPVIEQQSHFQFAVSPQEPSASSRSTWQASAESVTQVVSEHSMPHWSVPGVTPVAAEFVNEFATPAELPSETTIYFEAETIGNQSCLCREQTGWVRGKSHNLHRKLYFSQQGNHKKCLYPVIPPHCQPGYGIYETCWRQIQPNPCVLQSEELPHSDVLPPEPQTAPLAPSVENGASGTTAPQTVPRPYER